MSPLDPHFDDDGEPRSPTCVEDGSGCCNCLRCATSLAEEEAFHRAGYDAASPEERRAVIDGPDLDADADRRDFADECFHDRDFLSNEDEAAE